MKGLTLMIAKSLVDNPDEVGLQEVIGKKNNGIETKSRKRRFREGHWQAGENNLGHAHYPERDGA